MSKPKPPTAKEFDKRFPDDDACLEHMMRVRYGEDSTGLWFAGALWPDVSELDVARIQASAISGDWRPVALWRRGQTAHDFVG